MASCRLCGDRPMSKKRPPTDPPLTVRARRMPSGKGCVDKSEFAVFMTDPDGNVTVAEGRESDLETFRNKHDQTRNDVRRASKSEQLRHHQANALKLTEVSPEQKCLEREAQEALRHDLKRVLSTLEKTDPARSVLTHILAAGTDWDKTQEIADKLELEIQQVTVAKRKIQRRIKNNFPALQKHLGRASGF